MAALDITKSFLDAYRASLEARTVLMAAVKPGNRVYTSEADYLERESSRNAPADFPYYRVFCNGGTKTRGMVTHGTGSPVAEFDHPVAMTVDIEVRVAFDRLQDAAVTPYEAEIDAAIAGLLIYCRANDLRWIGPATARKSRTNTRINSSTLRTVVTWTISHECAPRLSQLLS
jgi:hypothetical protein